MSPHPRIGRFAGAGVVAGLHALALAWAWSVASAPVAISGPPPSTVLMARVLLPASLEKAPAAVPAAPRQAVAGPRLAATPIAWAPTSELHSADAGGDSPSPALPSPPAADVPPPSAAVAAQPTPQPQAPRRLPADHAGCAQVPHPAALRERGVEGLVQLRVQVGADGRARDVQLLGSSGWRLFDEAALAKARSCRFRPAYEGEAAVESWVEFPVRFALAPS